MCQIRKISPLLACWVTNKALVSISDVSALVRHLKGSIRRGGVWIIYTCGAWDKWVWWVRWEGVNVWDNGVFRCDGRIGWGNRSVLNVRNWGECKENL